jgi:hypothetical protein
VQTVKDVFGGEVRGLHSTYNNQIKEQVPILLLCSRNRPTLARHDAWVREQVQRSSKDTGEKGKSKSKPPASQPKSKP